MIAALDALKETLDAIPYPFAHATQGISCGLALIPVHPNARDPGDVHAAALRVVDRFYDLLYRALAELTTHAERIERGIGLEPVFTDGAGESVRAVAGGAVGAGAEVRVRAWKNPGRRLKLRARREECVRRHLSHGAGRGYLHPRTT